MTPDRQMIKNFRGRFSDKCACPICPTDIAICDLALQALALRDAEQALANEPPQGAMTDNWWSGFRAALAMLRARANDILASATPGQQIRHVCGAAGYGHPDDVCPACEAEDKSRATPSGEEGSK
jgi:hypothetical protein